MTFYIFALAAGLAVFCGLIAGSIAGDIQEQLPGITYDPNIPWETGCMAGIVSGAVYWMYLNHRLRIIGIKTARHLAGSDAVRNIMTGTTGEWRINLDNLQGEPSLEKNRFVELKDGQDLSTWLLGQLHRVEKELPNLRLQPYGGFVAMILLLAASISLYLLQARGIALELQPFSLLLVFMLVPFGSVDGQMRTQMLRYLLPEEVLRRLRA